MSSMKHPHTYERIKGTKDRYRCIHPDCSHWIFKHMMRGKRATCVCGNTFILTADSLLLKNPHCENCHRNAPAKRQREDVLEQMFAAEPEEQQMDLPMPKMQTELDHWFSSSTNDNENENDA